MKDLLPDFRQFMEKMESSHSPLYWHRQSWNHDDPRPCIRCHQLLTSVSEKEEYKRLSNADHPAVGWQRLGLSKGM